MGDRRQFQSWICTGFQSFVTHHVLPDRVRTNAGINWYLKRLTFWQLPAYLFAFLLCSGWNNTHHSYISLSTKSPERTKLHRPGRTGLLARTFQVTQVREGNKLSVAINPIIFLFRRFTVASLSVAA